jgi:YD repeat-containing protein
MQIGRFAVARTVLVLAAALTVALLHAQSGTTTYVYDSLNRVVEIRYPDRTIRYTYDAAGNRLTQSSSTNPCVYTVGSVSPLFAASGSGARVGVAASAGPCTWSATSTRPWIRITAGTPNSGNGAVSLFIEPNPHMLLRRGTVVIAGQSVVITQAGRRSERVSADFNADGLTDLLFHHQVTGDVGVWTMNGLQRIDAFSLTPSRVPDTRWQIVGTADFNSDARTDVLWQHMTEGWLAVWSMDGARQTDALFLEPARLPDPGWRVRAVADMNGDTRPDLVLQHAQRGSVAVWHLNGRSLTDGQLVAAPATDTAWQIVAAGDLDGDGWSDFVFQHDEGALAAWMMRGTERIDVLFLTPNRVPHPSWRVRAAADLDYDGRLDLLLQRTTTGELAAWLMNGTQLVDGLLLSPSQVPHPAWRLAGPK